MLSESTSWLQLYVLQSVSVGQGHLANSLSGRDCTLAKTSLGYFYKKGLQGVDFMCHGIISESR